MRRTFRSLLILIIVLSIYVAESMLLAASKQPYSITQPLVWDVDDWKSDGVSGRGRFTNQKQMADTNRWYKERFTYNPVGSKKMGDLLFETVLDTVKPEVRETFQLYVGIS